MMRVCVVSDSHGSVSSLKNAAEAAGKVDCYIHLGDHASDAAALEQNAGVPVYTVRGNCDAASSAAQERVITLDGARLLLTHGNAYGVGYDLFALALRAEELACQAALFGHTHVPCVEAQGPILLINPGSTSRPRGESKRSLAILEIDKGSVCPRIVLF